MKRFVVSELDLEKFKNSFLSLLFEKEYVDVDLKDVNSLCDVLKAKEFKEEVHISTK